jgi:O-antigen/teichoic acid export membrane protein
MLLSIGIVLICAAAPWFVGPLLGAEEWSGAGTILLMMAPALVGSFIFSSTNHLVVYGKQKWQFFSDAINIGTGLITIFLGGKYNLNIEVTILLFSIASLFTYLLRFYLHLIANSNYVKERSSF